MVVAVSPKALTDKSMRQIKAAKITAMNLGFYSADFVRDMETQ